MNTPNTIEDFASVFHEELTDYYPKEEIDAIIFLTVSYLLKITRGDIHLRKKQSVKPNEAEKLLSIIRELKTHKPIQYILGKTDFYGCTLRVNEHVLIPRPETEELVDLILKDVRHNTDSPTLLYKGKINILDIGTGSGCIAIALKKNIANANVNALEISEEALLIAKANAILNQTKISFLQADILQQINPPFSYSPDIKFRNRETEKRRNGESAFDIIVSNPPYVRISEKEKMSRNISDYEPHLALFVNDNDPLLFYNAIADFALVNLSPNGKLYFEINEALGNDVKNLLKEKGFKEVEVKKDMSGKERMVSGSTFQVSG